MDDKKNARITTSNNRSVWVFWVPLGLAIAIYLTISFIGNVLVIGTKLGTFHPVIEWGFYGSLVTLFLWLISAPILSVLTAPVMALEDITDKSRTRAVDSKTLRKIAQQMIDSKVLEPAANYKEKQSNEANASDNEDAWLKNLFTIGNEEELKKAVSNNDNLEKLKMLMLDELKEVKSRRGDLSDPLSMAITLQKMTATQVIHDHALLVLVSTTISQNGRLDAIAVLVTNFRLVKSLVQHFGYRPPLPTLIKVYAQIFVAALIADEIDDLDVANLLEETAPTLFTIIPGTSIIVNSVLNGAVNAILTLRVGFVAREYLLNVGSTLDKRNIRKHANKEAMCEFKSLRKDAGQILPNKISAGVKGYFGVD